MKAFTRTMVLGLATLGFAATVTAAEAPKRDAAALENSRDAVAWEAQNAKGVDKAQLKQEEQRIQDLIDNVQRGGQVDVDDIDRTLNRTR